jgi:hypothetical protein
MPESYVTALAVEGSPTLWIGTYSQHVARLDLATGPDPAPIPPAATTCARQGDK